MKKEFMKEYFRLCKVHFIWEVCVPLVFMLIAFVIGIAMIPITKLAIVQVAFWGVEILCYSSVTRDQFVRVYTKWKCRKEGDWPTKEVQEKQCKAAIIGGFVYDII